MINKILKLNNVKKLTTQQQKETIGGGDFGNINVVDNLEDTTTGPIPNWEWRCYSSGTTYPNKPQFFKSYTNLGYPYICNPI